MCRIIITTTTRGWDTSFHCIEVARWASDESVAYLASVLPSCKSDDLLAMADALHNHPLAIAQAANYCLTNNSSISVYLEKLERNPTRALASGKADGYDRSTNAAISLNIESATKQSPLARPMLTLLSYLSSDPVREEFFKPEAPAAWVRAWPFPESSFRNRLGRRFWRLGRTRLAYPLTGLSQKTWLLLRDLRDIDSRVNALNALVQHSLVKRTTDGLTVHPLVKMIVRSHVNEDAPWLELGMGLITNSKVQNSEDVLDRSLGHLQALLHVAEDNAYEGIAVVLDNFVLADRLVQFGDPRAAVRHGKRALAILHSRASAGNAIPGVVLYAVRNKLAAALYFVGETNEAVELLNANMELCAGLNEDWQAHSLQALAEVLPASENVELIEKLIDLLPVPSKQGHQKKEMLLSLTHSRFWLLRRLGRIDDAAVTINWAIDHLAEPSDSTAEFMRVIYTDAAIVARDLNRPHDVFQFANLALDCVRKSASQGERPNRVLIDALI
ncbi:MAG: hypothetical protein ACREUM_08055 [Nitrosospira sp.]